METLTHIVFSPQTYLAPAGIAFLKARLSEFLPDLLAGVAILVAGFLFYKLTAAPLRRLLVKSRIEAWLARIIAYNIYKFVVIVISIATALGQLGLNVVAALAGLGIAGLAIGFIAQDSLSNIVAGFLISIDKPFRVGDYITLGDYYGRIDLITMRSTRIRTQDNTYVVIPNQKIINDVLVDHSANGDTRISIGVSIAYEASIDNARAAILQNVGNIEGVLASPPPDVVVHKLAESGVNLLVRVWIADSSKERQIYFKTTETVKKALDSEGIEIAYPHMQLVGKRFETAAGTS